MSKKICEKILTGYTYRWGWPTMATIYKIQKFSIHDGPGIRTTVFFKGCPLRCLWCHNPESQPFGGDPAIPLNQLVAELEADRIFYDESGGGVTLSGGEPLAQDMDYIELLTKTLKSRGISAIIDTCGLVPYENFRRVLPYTDMFLYDLKLLDDVLHTTYTKASNERILANLAQLGRDKANICLRLPLLAGINDSLEDMEKIAAWLQDKGVNPAFISLLPYHLYGRNKYADLGLDAPPQFGTPDEAQLGVLKDFWQRREYRVSRFFT